MPGSPTPISYEYLYDCLWTVADLAAESEEMPGIFADGKGALYFQEKSGQVCLLRRTDELDDMTGGDPAYSLVAEGTHTIDRATRMVTIAGDDWNCYFRIERLNDRTMTLYYRDDPNSYVAYTRSGLDFVTVVR